MREEGELSDDSEADDNSLLYRVKRERGETENSDMQDVDRPRRREMYDEHGEFDHSSRREMFNAFNPEFASTGRREPSRRNNIRQNEERQHVVDFDERPNSGRFDGSRRQQASTSRANVSQSGSVKMFKVEPFPKNVKPTEQFQEWNYWIANFEMAIEKAGITDQRSKAIDLSLHIGEEIRRIIVAKDMMPRESQVESGFAFYDELIEHLEDHFRNLTDETVDVATFNAMKQGETETALEFELRLSLLAKRMRETNTAMIRTRYIEGLRDKELRERAFIDGIALKEVVKMATRKEAINADRGKVFSPWGNDGQMPLSVATISNENRYSRNVSSKNNDFRARGQGRNYRAEQNRNDTDRCDKCGVREHRSNRCPAENATCFGCQEVGHFRHMCTKQIRRVGANGNETNEITNKVRRN